MTDLSTERLGSVSSVGDSLGKDTSKDATPGRKKRRAPAPPPPANPTPKDAGDTEESTHQIDELA
ncbi:MAG: hypothetical protein WBQ68_06970 [Terriglobales bacterium]